MPGWKMQVKYTGTQLVVGTLIHDCRGSVQLSVYPLSESEDCDLSHLMRSTFAYVVDVLREL